MSGFDTLVAELKAAGEITRLRLLVLLADGELSVKDLTTILGQSQPRVSRHLKLLADAGLVQRHAEGAWAYYRLADPGGPGDLARSLVARLDPDDRRRAADLAALKRLRQDQQAAAAAYFATVAESWDMQRSLHVPESAVEAAIAELFAGRRLDLLLDLGTGTGRMLELLAPHYRRGVGIDSSREMIAVARSKLAAAAVGHAQVRLGDIAALDADTGPADAIVLHQVLHYFDDPGRLIGQVRRALKPGGQLLIVDFAPHGLEFLRERHAHRRLGLSDEQVGAWGRAAGLAVSTSRAFPNTADPAGLTVSLWLLADRDEPGVRSAA